VISSRRFQASFLKIPRIERCVQIANRNHLALAIEDFKDGVSSIYVWPKLGWLEIKQRYRRSVLGPFWLTISTGALVGGMGPLYGRLFGLDIYTYFLYLAISFVVWLFLAGIINDACMAFISAEGFIKHFKLPLTVHIMRMVWRNLIIFAHNLVIVFLVMLFWPPAITWQLLLIPLGVLFIAINGIWIGLCLGLLCARFRDIPQIVNSLVQVAFFLTPVMWQPQMLGRNQWAATWNPFYHFLEIVRAPLVAATTNWFSWTVVLGITVIGYAVTFLLFARFRARIAYWV
jgi:ABC-type polysaccharide/polyol phosphate export permease